MIMHALAQNISYIINVERFTGLNIRGFSLMKFLQKYFHGASTTSVYYLTITKYSWKNSLGTLKNHEYRKGLAQWIFLRLQYILYGSKILYYKFFVKSWIFCESKLS